MREHVSTVIEREHYLSKDLSLCVNEQNIDFVVANYDSHIRSFCFTSYDELDMYKNVEFELRLIVNGWNAISVSGKGKLEPDKIQFANLDKNRKAMYRYVIKFKKH